VAAPAIITLSEKIAGRVTALARGEMIRRAAFCSNVLTANEVTSMAVSDFSRTGRNATSSVSRLVNMATRTAIKAITNQGKGVKPVSRYRVYPPIMTSSP
jgi:glycine cleavage system pyridoxal-binding protein P